MIIPRARKEMKVLQMSEKMARMRAVTARPLPEDFLVGELSDLLDA